MQRSEIWKNREVFLLVCLKYWSNPRENIWEAKFTSCSHLLNLKVSSEQLSIVRICQKILKSPFVGQIRLVLESMRAREPGLQAPSNLAGSKIKITHFPPLLILSQRYPIMVKEPIM